jgi:hypothetical protein
VSTNGPYPYRRGRGGSFFSAQRFFIISEIRRFAAALNRRRRRKIGLLRLPLLDRELRMAIARSNRSFCASKYSIIRRISMYDILRYTTEQFLGSATSRRVYHLANTSTATAFNHQNPSLRIPV